MPLYKVILGGSLNETFYIHSTDAESARITALEIVLDDPLIYFMPFEDVQEVNEDIEEDDLNE